MYLFYTLFAITFLTDPKDFDADYTRHSDVLHCTTLYAGGSDEPNVIEYMKRAEVTRSMGKMFHLTIIGFTVTARTVGARVKLTRRQLMLWGKHDEHVGLNCKDTEITNTTDATSSTMDSGQSDGFVKTKQLSLTTTKCTPGTQEAYVATSTSSREKRVPEMSDDVAGPVPYETRGFGSTAHITLGVSEGNSPVDTGIDLARIIECEACSKPPTCVLESGEQVRNFGNGTYAVYLHDPLVVKSLFSCVY